MHRKAIELTVRSPWRISEPSWQCSSLLPYFPKPKTLNVYIDKMTINPVSWLDRHAKTNQLQNDQIVSYPASLFVHLSRPAQTDPALVQHLSKSLYMQAAVLMWNIYSDWKRRGGLQYSRLIEEWAADCSSVSVSMWVWWVGWSPLPFITIYHLLPCSMSRLQVRQENKVQEFPPHVSSMSSCVMSTALWQLSDLNINSMRSSEQCVVTPRLCQHPLPSQNLEHQVKPRKRMKWFANCW